MFYKKNLNFIYLFISLYEIVKKLYLINPYKIYIIKFK